MIAEDAIIEFIQFPLADEAKIRDIFFFFPGKRPASVFPRAKLQRDGAGLSAIGHAIAKTVVTGPENRPVHAMTGCFPVLMNNPQAVSVAGTAGDSSKPEHVRSIPLHSRMSSWRGLKICWCLA